MSPKAFAARYPGSCSECGGDFKTGDRVAYTGDREVMHASYPACIQDHYEPPICPKCYVSHESECRNL